jgi:DNA-binding transcriptional LysR family regulator
MHQIRYFLAVSRTLNFTRAAEECHVAQPSLTRAIKLLEAELGGELFLRERNLTHLTDFGRRMLPLLSQCFESAQAAKSLASSIKSGTIASLTLALSHAINLSLLVKPLTELIRVFPGLELHFRRGTPDEVAAFLKKGDAQLVVAGPLPAAWERLESWPLFTEPFVAVVGAKHILAGTRQVQCADLAAHCLLGRPYCEMMDQLTEFFRDYDLGWSGRHEVVCEEDLTQLVGAGLGVGILPHSTACVAGLPQIEIAELTIARPVSLFAVSGRERTTPAAALVKLLRARDWSAEAVGRDISAQSEPMQSAAPR